MNKLLLILFFNAGTLSAQQGVQKDTSFTVHSAFQKEVKKFPFIRIAAPNLPIGVLVKENQIYHTIEGRSLHLDVFYPAKNGQKKYPGVLLIHGGGWKSGDKSQSIPMAIQLAAKGYVAVAVEYRLSPEAPFPAALHDLKAAVRWMRSHARTYKMNKKKVAALGVSAGGQLAALLGTTNGKKEYEGAKNLSKKASTIQAIVDIDGILAFKHPESAEGVVAAEWLGGTYDQKPDVWADASPLTHAGKKTPPVLFINSAIPRFHAGRDDMIKKLQHSGIYTEVHTLPDTPHPFWLFHPWFEPTVDYTVSFLDKVF